MTERDCLKQLGILAAGAGGFVTFMYVAAHVVNRNVENATAGVTQNIRYIDSKLKDISSELKDAKGIGDAADKLDNASATVGEMTVQQEKIISDLERGIETFNSKPTVTIQLPNHSAEC